MPKKEHKNQQEHPVVTEGDESKPQQEVSGEQVDPEQTGGKKKAKTKIIYYDDGSTIADMSGTYNGGKHVERKKSTFKEKMQTYFAVMKKMILPLLCTLMAFTLIYLFLLLITGNIS